MSKPSRKKSKKTANKKDQAKRLVDAGSVLHLNRDVKHAELAYRKAIELDPLNFRALYLLGILHSECGKNADAIEFLELALKVNPNYSLAYNDIGVVYQQMGKIEEATAAYSKALELNKDFYEAKNNLGVAIQSRGNMEKAKEYYAEALRINPYYLDSFGNLIFAKDMAEDETVESLIAIRKEWAKVHEEPHLSKQEPVNPDIFKNPKIRVAYCGADFRLHSASFCFGTMLVNYDRDKFEVYCYSNNRADEDVRTQQFKDSVTVFRNVYGMSDDELASLIRKDGIHILIDLGTFSAGARLSVFALKPAFVQMTGWGYATSSGLRSMDYFLADDVIVPPEEKHLYVEDVVHMPCVVNYFGHDNIITEVAETPALKHGIITFGSFNRVAKISDSSFKMFAACLEAVPNSRFLFKINEADPNATKDRIVQIMVGYGVDPKRLFFAGKTSLLRHLQTFDDIDIHLDSFPHSGGLTTVDAILCGVPVVTLRWPTIVGRLSASILTRVGLTDWIANTKEDYVRIVKEKCADINALNELRKTMRDRFNSSPLGDSVGYCRAVEAEYVRCLNDKLVASGLDKRYE